MRAGIAFVVVVVAAFVGACPDPCAFGGCYVTSDCAADQVCRKSREGEFDVCAIVPGTCIASQTDRIERCGSIDDCDGGDCCDPITNTCVAPSRYPGPGCDAATCPDCTDVKTWAHCSSDLDCPDNEGCRDTSSAGGLCLERCEDGDGCAGGECVLGLCEFPLGTLCVVRGFPSGSPIPERNCGGNNTECVDENVAGQKVTPYCSGSCVGEDDVCPAGFSCEIIDCVSL
ncbi:MAG: hypothetical protein Q8O67_04765 [Deltaproteobacteria bacterium]|nr:hypothetical protein [Deltaproteobacteria bacterium]